MAGSRSRPERSSRSSSFRRALSSHLTSGHATFPLKRRRGRGKRGFDRAGGQAHTARSVSPRTRIDAGSGPVLAALSPPFSALIEQVAFPKPARVVPRKHRPGQLAVQVLLDDDGRGHLWPAMRRSAAGRRRRRCACPSSPAARPRRERREDEFREPFPPVRVDDRRNLTVSMSSTGVRTRATSPATPRRQSLVAAGISRKLYRTVLSSCRARFRTRSAKPASASIPGTANSSAASPARSIARPASSLTRRFAKGALTPALFAKRLQSSVRISGRVPRPAIFMANPEDSSG